MFIGTMVMRKYNAVYDPIGQMIGNGRMIFESVVMKNRLVSGAGGYGRNIIMRQMTNDTTYAMPIVGAKIGTGTNVPADSDTDLQTPTTLTGITIIPIGSSVLSNDSVVFSFYITDAQLPNGTYKEFGMYANTSGSPRIMTRILISPNFTKGSNQNTSVDYTLSLATA